ncbi:peptidase domain-containing ABC transporter [Massilia sp. YMA4]|uniref:Peptidase domain-containing ABC transporter n=1 Tax=[Empedobacter] haloabium TaxID=592317 RepID=A0ABZ1USB5_9BURK|nr:peptidase domain-containing ABC transporter [Massilia sp. YMA4]AXA91311.1 peptidase domain-containing ABC transporter [Massilia sp. YMA4]
MYYQQVEVAECGLVCIAYAAAKLGAQHDLIDLRRRFDASSRGLNFQQMAELAASLHLHARGVQCSVDELKDLALPAVLHWGLKHFVVLERVSRNTVRIFDPSKGRQTLKYEQVSKCFTGVALEISRAQGFKRRKEPSPLSILSWVRLGPELYRGMIQVAVLSILLQLYILASPFYMQLAMDQAALKGDLGLLSLLAIGFGAYGLFNAVAMLLRGYVTQQMSAWMSWDMSVRLFRHMIRLPLPWFQKRRLADSISRFEAVNPIRDLISGSLIASLIDGVLAITTAIMMLVFSPMLALIAIVGVFASICISLLSLPNSLRMGGEALTAKIAESEKRMEILRSIQTVKTMSAEGVLEQQWSNRYNEVLRTNVANGRYTIAITSLQQAVHVIVSTIIVYFGARQVMDATMTVGLLFAFVAYQTQFKNASSSLIAQIIQWRLTDIYSHRLADIVLSQVEPGLEIQDSGVRPSGHIEIDNISFRYGPTEPFVLRNVSLRIQPGESLAIVGPSGIGKSTFMKVIAGLYMPATGEVRLDKRPIATWGLKAVRKNIGVVLQDDELLSGTVLENVTFFSSDCDRHLVLKVLDAVGMKDEVLSMPMKEDTFIGDMGGSISGGQKQRLLLARALYKNPCILLLDEATSHLDTLNEKRINAFLKEMKITRIIIAHRPETICSADKIFDLAARSFLSPAMVAERYLSAARPKSPAPDLGAATQPVGAVISDTRVSREEEQTTGVMPIVLNAMGSPVIGSSEGRVANRRQTTSGSIDSVIIAGNTAVL